MRSTAFVSFWESFWDLWLELCRYKCPKCRAAYCSVACCKLHKQNNCTLAQPPAQQAKPKSRYLPSDLLQRDPDVNSKVRRQQLLDDEFDDLDDGWKITADMMNAMDKSDWLHRELADGGLRQIITEIVTASKNVSGNGKTFQSEALSQFQSKFPNFRTFLDKLLVITGVLERQNEEMEEELADWLLRKEDLGDLALKPICKERSQDSNENEYPTRTSTSPSGDSSSCTDTSDSD